MRMQDYIARYDSLHAEENFFNIPLHKEYLLGRIGRGKKVLDVGCMGGKLSSLIAERNNEVWGVELNPAAAAVAAERGIRVKVANVEDGLPFDDAAFDVVNAGQILEQLYDTKHFFLEAWRVLRPGGALLFTATNLNSLENRLAVARGRYLSMAGAYPEDQFGRHIRVFNVDKVRELCAQTGFILDELRGIPTLESRGPLLDRPLGLAGRLLPGLSKVLMGRAFKNVGN